MRAKFLTPKLGHSKSLAFCILVEKYNQYKKGSLSFGCEDKFRLPNPALRIAETVVVHLKKTAEIKKDRMKTIDLTLTGSNEPITVIVQNIKTVKNQKYNYGDNYTIIEFIGGEPINVVENIEIVKKLINS